MLEPICSPLFRPILAPFRPLFVSSFFTQRQNLCYLLVTFIWSPRVLDLSRSSLLHLAASRPPTLCLSFSPSLFHPLYVAFHVQLAITYQQPAASNSPELLIPDFRPVGETLIPFLLPPPPRPPYSLLFFLPSFSPYSTSFSEPTTCSSLSAVA